MPKDVKVAILEEDGVEFDYPAEHKLLAEEIPYNNTTSGLLADEVQSAIDELKTLTGSVTTEEVSSGFSFGRSGNNTAGTWLARVGNVTSNKVGLPIPTSNSAIKSVSVKGENSSATFDIEIYEHDGTTFTLLTTVNVVSSRGAFVDGLNIPVTQGLELAAKISLGSAKNLGVTVQVKGTQ